MPRSPDRRGIGKPLPQPPTHEVSNTTLGHYRVVAENDKQRFACDNTGLRIRANQGHSTEVDLDLKEARAFEPSAARRI